MIYRSVGSDSNRSTRFTLHKSITYDWQPHAITCHKNLNELNALDRDDYYWLIHEEAKNSNVTNYNGTKVTLGKLSNLAMDVEAREWVQGVNFDINVVPYGSGSSFLGFLQRYWIDKNRDSLGKDYWDEVKNRTDNLWDDEYGVTFRSMNTLEDTKHNEFVNKKHMIL